MISAAFSASMMVGALRFPLTMLGMTLASTILRLSTPNTWRQETLVTVVMVRLTIMMMILRFKYLAVAVHYRHVVPRAAHLAGAGRVVVSVTVLPARPREQDRNVFRCDS